MLKLFPELAGRYHLMLQARVADNNNGLQLQPLSRDGSEDPATPVVKLPPLPVTTKAGNVVQLGFRYGDPSEPFALTLSTAAIGQVAGSQVTIEGYGTKPAVIAEHLQSFSRLGRTTAPVDSEGRPLPDATTSSLTKFEFEAGVKDGDTVACLPIEEGERFLVVAKLGGL